MFDILCIENCSFTIQCGKLW